MIFVEFNKSIMTRIKLVEAPKVIIGEPETIVVTLDIQTKMDKIGNLLPKEELTTN